MKNKFDVRINYLSAAKGAENLENLKRALEFRYAERQRDQQIKLERRVKQAYKAEVKAWSGR